MTEINLAKFEEARTALLDERTSLLNRLAEIETALGIGLQGTTGSRNKISNMAESLHEVIREFSEVTTEQVVDFLNARGHAQHNSGAVLNALMKKGLITRMERGIYRINKAVEWPGLTMHGKSSVVVTD